MAKLFDIGDNIMLFSKTRNFNLLIITRENGERAIIQRAKTLENALKIYLDKMSLEELISLRNIYAVEYGTFRSCEMELENAISQRSRQRLVETLGPALVSKLPPHVKIKVY
jgi:hypothetical protein